LSQTARPEAEPYGRENEVRGGSSGGRALRREKRSPRRLVRRPSPTKGKTKSEAARPEAEPYEGKTKSEAATPPR